ncbi:MAG: protease complex subunit PrcB family protein [Pseudomonadales bacterium]|nr:protease complex subunit PrcB family protein [Pseudomonadales bacterium]
MQNRMKQRLYYLVTGGLVLWLAGCQTHTQTDPQAGESTSAVQTVPVSKLAEHQHCGYFGATARVDVLRELDWKQVLPLGATPPAIALPKGELGVMIYLGQRPTAGYRLKLAGDATLERGKLTLSIEEEGPPPNVFVAQVLTSPCVLYSVPEKTGFNRVEIKGNSKGLPVGIALE